MTSSQPDPEPTTSPDLDAGGSPVGPQTPDSDSMSLESDSARTGQSPTKTGSSKGIVIILAIVAVVVLAFVIGLAAKLLAFG